MQVPLQIFTKCMRKCVSMSRRQYLTAAWWSCVHQHNRAKCARFQLQTETSSFGHCPSCRWLSTQNVAFENQPPSWLFVSDAIAGVYGAQVNLQLDLEQSLTEEGVNRLKSNLKARHVELDVDLLLTEWNKLVSLKRLKDELINKKDTILAEIRKLKAEQQSSSEEIQSSIHDLVQNLTRLKKEIAGLVHIWDIEEKVVLMALKLPNDLHETTPLHGPVITRQSEHSIEVSSSASHIHVAKQHNLIKFSNIGPKAYYLQAELVQAEMALIDYMCNFLRANNYREISGPEFFKTPIMEGCGQDVFNADEVLTMLDHTKDEIEPMNHLAGVSAPMFAAYVARTCIGDNILPLNMFACGRRYKSGNLPGLFGAVQSTQAGVFSCAKTEELDKQFEKTVNVIWNLLEPLGFPLRECQICAKDLRREERRRVELQMFAPSLDQSIPVASVSDLGEFVSRRLMVFHNQNHADIRSGQLVSMISGTAINITSLLAIWLEYSYKDQGPFSLQPLPVFKTR